MTGRHRAHRGSRTLGPKGRDRSVSFSSDLLMAEAQGDAIKQLQMQPMPSSPYLDNHCSEKHSEVVMKKRGGRDKESLKCHPTTVQNQGIQPEQGRKGE